MNQNKKPFQARQGDVLIEESSIPAGAEKQNGRVILAYGEVTNHQHEIHDGAELWKQGDDVFVNVKKPTQLKHQEHAPIDLKRGALKVTRQREYSPAEIRRVAD